MYTATGKSEKSEKNDLLAQYMPMVKRLAHHMMGRLPPSVEEDDLVQAVAVTTQSETPGLGSKIVDDPDFSAQFAKKPVSTNFSLAAAGGQVQAPGQRGKLLPDALLDLEQGVGHGGPRHILQEGQVVRVHRLRGNAHAQHLQVPAGGLQAAPAEPLECGQPS